ncbi:MAG: hypothetical protein KY476_04290 [Planctomycetes bacterium]|nr:hypothetical protein [Planctomycetota bacterium]
MLDSARRGDVDGWLNLFAGDARETLAAEVREKTRELAAAELKAAEADLKSFVTTGHQRLGEAAVEMVLERIYPRHTDRHRVRLERTADGWRIVETEPIERSAPEIPYGTPVVPDGE